MPSFVVGAELLSRSARNWTPNSRSRTHRPSAVSHSPGVADGSEPTTATSSRWPFTLTLSTTNPFSSLKNVTRSIRPERLSTDPDAGFCNRGHHCSRKNLLQRRSRTALHTCENLGCDAFTLPWKLSLLIQV